MLGTLGFTIGAFTIALFAATSYRAYRFVNQRRLTLFCSAFAMLAVAMLLWAMAAASSSDVVILHRLLFASDVLLLTGTAAMVALLFKTTNVLGGILLTMVGAVALAFRATAYPPTGFVQNGLLYFNLNGGVRFIVLLAFVLGWLPGMVLVASEAAHDPVLEHVSSSLKASFVSLVLVSSLFLTARRSGVMITLFVLVAALFLVMSFLNWQISSAQRAQKGKKHASSR